MPEPQSPEPSHTKQSLGGDFRIRVVSALVLAPVAIAANVAGGYLAIALITIVTLLILREWNRMAREGRIDAVFMVSAACLLGAGAIIALGLRELALLLLAVNGAIVVASVFVTTPAAWAVRGLFYALVPLVAILLLRGSATHGAEAIFFLFAVVWTTDVAAFFAGRLIGGPKLWPQISPKKTWAGFIGGTLGAAAAGYGVARLMGLSPVLPLIFVAIILSIAAHAGDLFESAVKRHFHHKDSGHIIPGHGGVMDRFDGFIAASLVGLLIGLVRANLGDTAGGLLLWP